MENKNLNVVITDGENNDSVAFPVSPEKLGKFISGLLGQPQTIQREVPGVFEVNLPWLQHINALIDQRIRQQNEAARTSFKAIIYYEDNFIRTLETYEAFNHFSETKKIRSTGVKIIWSYLIRFPGKEMPEKQEITFWAVEKAPMYLTAGIPIGRRRFNDKFGLITYSISHTERTWGDDIEAILRQEIDLVTKKTEWYEHYFETAMMVLGLLFFVSGFLFPEYMNDKLQNQSLLKLQAAVAELSSQQPIATIDIQKKLDIVLQFVDPRNQLAKVGIIYRILCAATGFGVLFLCAYLSDFRRSSFVVLTREAEQFRDKALAKEKRRTFVIILSFLASITTGVLSNYVYLYLTN